MTLEARTPFDRTLLAIIGLCSIAVVATCSGQGQVVVLDAPAHSASAPAPRADGPHATLASSGDAKRARIAADKHPLAGFFSALGALSRGTRETHVRLLWFGDSHTAADFWPDAVRSVFARRFGGGGPGFSYLGLRRYRHAGLQVSSTGNWRREPPSPASIKPWGDTVFGLGGVRTVPESGTARAEIEVEPGALLGDAHFTVLYRAAPGTSLELSLDGNSVAVPPPNPERVVQRAGVVRSGTAPGSARLTLGRKGGRLELFGVVVEGGEAGVVVDTLGIDGARVATPLAWDAAAFEAEVRARAPSLVVLAYGTNEVFDAHSPELYADHYRELLARLRKAEPNVGCLIVGPPDVATPEGATHPRVLEITLVQHHVAEELGCGFSSALEAMGGPGSFSRWATRTPSWAREDGIHLTPSGYEELGRRLAEGLLEEYARALGE
ncbi:MAG TPA: GDSL-type esterase/lipase family protein [Polyangiaceae bacterium]